MLKASKTGGTVALRKESVDRNKVDLLKQSAVVVALRKESVDRNTASARPSHAANVALRKESVDRNRHWWLFGRRWSWSLSARRAWIEIFATGLSTKSISVALRKESVDRNLPGRHFVDLGQVALRKESVDRNVCNAQGVGVITSRSPQGERG